MFHYMEEDDSMPDKLEEDGDLRVQLVFGAQFEVLLKKRHLDHVITLQAIELIMIEQAAQGRRPLQKQDAAGFERLRGGV